MAELSYLYDKDGKTIAIECNGQTHELLDDSIAGSSFGPIRDLQVSVRSTYEQMLDSASTNSIVVGIEATHGGYTNGNSYHYLASGMKKATSTWTSPYGKPYLVEHDMSTDPLGRVIDAKFVTTGKTTGFHDLNVRIGDKTEIERILDARSLTVSVGSQPVDTVECSVCGHDLYHNGNTPKQFDLTKPPTKKWLEAKAPGFWGEFGLSNADLWEWDSDKKTCLCRHIRGIEAPQGGSQFDKLHWLLHGQAYREVSRVNVPADVNKATGEFAHIREVLEQTDSLDSDMRERMIAESLSRVGNSTIDRSRFSVVSEKDLYYPDSQTEAVSIARSGKYANLFDAGLWLSVQGLYDGLSMDERVGLYHQAGGKFICPISTASAQDAMGYSPTLFSRWLRAQDDISQSDKEMIDRLYTRAFIRKRHNK